MPVELDAGCGSARTTHLQSVFGFLLNHQLLLLIYGISTNRSRCLADFPDAAAPL
jgi:hypothetical protein